jgi:uncharacterized coiled-coil protein SlyX
MYWDGQAIQTLLDFCCLCLEEHITGQTILNSSLSMELMQQKTIENQQAQIDALIQRIERLEKNTEEKK